MSKELVDVATVMHVYHYPVKSMRGQSLVEAKVGWHGLAGDRRFAFARTDDTSGLPWLSARELPALICYEASFVEPSYPNKSPIIVKTLSGRILPLESRELLQELEELYQGSLRLMQLWRGTFDSMDVSLISYNAIRALSQTAGQALELERFRPNIVVEALDGNPYPEDEWIGQLLAVGSGVDASQIRVNRKDLRCSIVNLDPKTAERGPDILAVVAKNRRNLLGVYGSTERPGTIRVGHMVRKAKTSDYR